MGAVLYPSLPRTPKRNQKQTLPLTPTSIGSHASCPDNAGWGSSSKPAYDWGLTPPTTPDPGRSTKYNDACSPLTGKRFAVAKGSEQGSFERRQFHGIEGQSLHPGEKGQYHHISGKTIPRLHDFTFKVKIQDSALFGASNESKNTDARQNNTPSDDNKTLIFKLSYSMKHGLEGDDQKQGLAENLAEKLPGRSLVSEGGWTEGPPCRRGLSTQEPERFSVPPEEANSVFRKNVLSSGEITASKVGSNADAFLRADSISEASDPGAKVLEDKSVDDAEECTFDASKSHGPRSPPPLAVWILFFLSISASWFLYFNIYPKVLSLLSHGTSAPGCAKKSHTKAVDKDKGDEQKGDTAKELRAKGVEEKGSDQTPIGRKEANNKGQKKTETTVDLKPTIQASATTDETTKWVLKFTPYVKKQNLISLAETPLKASSEMKKSKDQIPGYIYIYRIATEPDYVKIGFTEAKEHDCSKKGCVLNTEEHTCPGTLCKCMCSSRNILKRFNQQKRKCGIDYELVTSLTPSRPATLHVYRVEQLIHARLVESRRQFRCKKCTSKGKPRHHIEWFRIDGEEELGKVQEVCEKFIAWMKKGTYKQDGKLSVRGHKAFGDLFRDTL